MKVSNHTFLISGGASGLGRACCDELVAHGGHVAILDLDEEGGRAVVERLGSSSSRFYACDVGESESIAKAVEGVVEWSEQTGKTIGGAVTAAGISEATPMIKINAEPLDMATFDRIMSINVRGTMDLARQVSAAIVRQQSSPAVDKSRSDGEEDGGVIIMLSSVAAFEGVSGLLAYAASKGAVRSMALPMARDLAPCRIRAVAVAPGVFDTEIMRAASEDMLRKTEDAFIFPARLGRPPEFAGLVRHIVENVMINGETIRLDGASRF